MEELYKWLIAHPMYASVISNIIVGVICLFIDPKKVKMAGFAFSQLIRKTLGQKAEQKVEEIGTAFTDGMKGDNGTK